MDFATKSYFQTFAKRLPWFGPTLATVILCSDVFELRVMRGGATCETFGSFSQSLTVRPTHQLSIESTDSLEIAAPEAPFTTIASQRTALALWIP